MTGPWLYSRRDRAARDALAEYARVIGHPGPPAELSDRDQVLFRAGFHMGFSFRARLHRRRRSTPR